MEQYKESRNRPNIYGQVKCVNDQKTCEKMLNNITNQGSEVKIPMRYHFRS